MTFLNLTSIIAGLVQVLWSSVWLYFLIAEGYRLPFLWPLALAWKLRDNQRIGTFQITQIGDKFSARQYKGDGEWSYLRKRSYRRGYEFAYYESDKFESENVADIQQIISDFQDQENPEVMKEYTP